MSKTKSRNSIIKIQKRKYKHNQGATFMSLLFKRFGEQTAVQRESVDVDHLKHLINQAVWLHNDSLF